MLTLMFLNISGVITQMISLFTLILFSMVSSRLIWPDYYYFCGQKSILWWFQNYLKSNQKHFCVDFKIIEIEIRNIPTDFIFIKMISVGFILYWFQKCLKCLQRIFLLWFQKCLNTSQKLFIAANNNFSVMISGVLEMFSVMISGVLRMFFSVMISKVFSGKLLFIPWTFLCLLLQSPGIISLFTFVFSEKEIRMLK